MATRSRVNDTENDSSEIPIPATHSDQVLAASGQKSSSTEESCKIDTEDTGGRTHESESNATHDASTFNPDADGWTIKWRRKTLIPNWFCDKTGGVAEVWEAEGLQDRQGGGVETWPQSNQSWNQVGCDEQRHNQTNDQSPLVGKEFADDTKKEELFAATPGLPALRKFVSQLATNKCGE